MNCRRLSGPRTVPGTASRPGHGSCWSTPSWSARPTVPRASRTCSTRAGRGNRHRQAAFRHDGNPGGVPVCRLGRRQGQVVLPRVEGQRRAGALGQQAGGHGGRVGTACLRLDRHRRRHGRGRCRQSRGRSFTPTENRTNWARCSSPTRWHSSRARAVPRPPGPWPTICSARTSRRHSRTVRVPRSPPVDHDREGPGRDPQDRPRDGSRLRSGGEIWDQTAAFARRVRRRMNRQAETGHHALGLILPQRGRVLAWSRCAVWGKGRHDLQSHSLIIKSAITPK